MSLLKLLGAVLNITLVLFVVYFIYDYIQTPLYLKELTKEYNELVDHFQIAVRETAIAYIHFGSKEDGVPVTIQIRSATGELIKTKKSSISPLLYDTKKDAMRSFMIKGYIKRDRVYMYSMMVKETDQNTWQESIFDAKIDLNNKDPDFENPVSNPSLWIREDDDRIDENQSYELVVNQAGRFALVRAYTFKNIEGLPDEAPRYMDYKKTLNGITKR